MPNPMQDCRNCRHFFITHEIAFPYGCRVMNFKSRRPPGDDVRETSGLDCLRYQPRATKPASPSHRPDIS